MIFTPTPIHPVEKDARGNRFFFKREDMLPYSFGGNKARIGLEYMQDMHAKNGDHMVAYGNARSNLCRVLSNLCAGEGIPITILSPADDDGERREAYNEKLCRAFGARIVPCLKTDVAQSVDSVMTSLRAQGSHPYYIYGDHYGRGNEAVPTAAYVPVYDEIRRQGTFDIIALACGTGMTMAGLLCGQRRSGGSERIVGISIARDAQNASAHIAAYANAWLKEDVIKEECIEICDAYRLAYGVYDDHTAATMQRMMKQHGIPMDGTYTGKAYSGLLRLAEAQGWRDQRILFIHTGGTPLYFDSLA